MIKTQRLNLRPYHQGDLEILVRELNNFNITRNTAHLPRPYLHKDAVEYLTFAETLNTKSLAQAIALAGQTEELIGGISYLYSPEKNDAELGYWLSESQWRKGLMSEAAKAMVHHAFTVSDIETLVACYHNDNPVSANILKKLGFAEVTQCTNFSMAQGKHVAVTNMKLTRDQWFSQQKSRGA